jgi:hypothetical protein
VALPLVGWLGALMVIGAYLAIKFEWWHHSDPIAAQCNIIGPILVAIPALSVGSYHFAALLAAWILITVAGQLESKLTERETRRILSDHYVRGKVELALNDRRKRPDSS